MSNLPIRFETPTILEFPKICMCCGIQTGHRIVLKVVDAKPDKTEPLQELLGLLFVPLHIFNGLKYLKKPKVKIPLCWNCHLKQFVPHRSLWASYGLMLADVLLIAYFGLRDDREHLPLCLITLPIIMIALVIHVRRWRPVPYPIRAFKIESGFIYVVYEGPLYAITMERVEQGLLTLRPTNP